MMSLGSIVAFPLQLWILLVTQFLVLRKAICQPIIVPVFDPNYIIVVLDKGSVGFDVA